MTLFRNRYRVETTRLPDYDYGSGGWYHVVVCTHERVCFFGEVVNGAMDHSRIGAVAHRFCADIPDHFDHVAMDAFVVMPNHVHAIIGLTSPARGDATRSRRDARSRVSTNDDDGTTDGRGHPFGPLQPGTLSTVVHAYKAAVTRWARRHGHDDFAWQPRFYDRIIRNERHLRATRAYVHANPANWTRDRLHR